MDLTGIEPVTSSMPCYGCHPKLLTAWHLLVGKTGKTGLISGICYQNATKNPSTGDRAVPWAGSPIDVHHHYLSLR